MSDETLEEFWAKMMKIAYDLPSGPEMLFRGVTDENYTLAPSIGRDTAQNTGNYIDTLEENLLNEFKRLTVPILKSSPQSEFEWLFLAQHYGLPTRLLDWSSNPLIGLFFATEREDEKDGAIYYLQHNVTDQYHLFDYRTATYTAEYKSAPASIFALQENQGKVIFVRPKYTDERYINQKSVFSCPQDPFSPLDLSSMKKIIVRSAWKERIRRRLRVLGISTSFIYPGLAGISEEIKSLFFNPVACGKTQMLTFRCDISLGQGAL